jgi:exosortase
MNSSMEKLLSEGKTGGATGIEALLRRPLVWVCCLLIGLSGWLYWPLFFPPTHLPLDVRGEEFLFQANEAAGAPVLILVLWLFYRRSHYRDLLGGPGAPVAATAFLIASAALLGWGTYTHATDLQLASLIVLLTGVALLLGGWPGLRAYWVPILYMAFALPLSPVLLAWAIYPIQLMTAQYAGLILNTFGIESLVQGDQILRPENTFIVIETCSGVRTMFTLSMLTVLMIDLFERKGWHALILLGLAPLVAFLTNGVRVVTLVVNPASSIHSVHNLQGIAMLLVGLTAIYLIDGRLEHLLGSRVPNAEDGGYGLARMDRPSPRADLIRLIVVSALLVFMLGLSRFGPTWKGVGPLEEGPDELLTRVFGEDPQSPYRMDYNFVGSVHYLAQARHRVEVDGAGVEIFLGVANEQQREYSILTKRLAWPASGYAPISESFVERDVELEVEPKAEIGVEAENAGRLARRMELRRGAHSVITYSWIERRGSGLTEWFRQALALDGSPLVRPEHMLAIRLTTTRPPTELGLAAAEKRIRRVWARLAPELVGYARTGSRD